MLSELHNLYTRDRKSVGQTMMSQILEAKIEALDLEAKPKSFQRVVCCCNRQLNDPHPY